MAYARFGDSDVYVYATSHSKDNLRRFVCDLCSIMPNNDDILEPYVCKDPQDMIDHLYKHMDSGDRVPMTAIERLKKEGT